MANKSWRLFLLVLVLSCARQGPKPESASIDGIVRASRFNNLLVCSQPSKEALTELAAEGYKTVLSTRGESELSWDEKAEVESLGMTFVNIPMVSPIKEITDEQVDSFDKAMKNSDGLVVLHCGSGNRVSGLWAVWMVEKQKMDAETAMNLASQTGMKGVEKVVRDRLGLSKAAE